MGYGLFSASPSLGEMGSIFSVATDMASVGASVLNYGSWGKYDFVNYRNNYFYRFYLNVYPSGYGYVGWALGGVYGQEGDGFYTPWLRYGDPYTIYIYAVSSYGYTFNAWYTDFPTGYLFSYDSALNIDGLFTSYFVLTATFY